jgi:TRAP-type C4-dicarboxylate transport system permease small subunit
MHNTERTAQGPFANFVLKADAACRRLARFLVLTAGWGVLAIGFMVAADVVARNLTGRNIGGIDEISGYLFAIGISWSLAEGFYARSHVRIDALYQRLPLTARSALDLLSVLALLLLAAFLIYSGWIVVSGTWLRASRSASSLQIPLIIPQVLWFLGFVVFLASLVLAGLRAALAIGPGGARVIEQQLGVMSASEEADEAVKQSLGR